MSDCPDDGEFIFVETYEPIAQVGRANIHCRALTGRILISGQCWGHVSWYERRGEAVAFCLGHRGVRYTKPPDATVDLPTSAPEAREAGDTEIGR